MRKNIATDVFGTKTLKIHLGKQQADDIQTRKVKALKIQKKTVDISNNNEEMEIDN